MSPNNDKMTVPLHKYHRKLMQEIDDAEWMGDFDAADGIKPYADEAAEMIAQGATRYPLF